MIKIADIEDIKTLNCQVRNLGEASIQDVYFKNLTRHTDARGDLTELWSQSWPDHHQIAPDVKHVYSNTTHHGVIKAWHYHQQTESQYTCIYGKLHVILVDVRPESSTYAQVNHFLIGTHQPSYIRIPAGILKGWKSLQGDSVIVNLLTTANTQDNYKLPWDTLLTDLWLPQHG